MREFLRKRLTAYAAENERFDIVAVVDPTVHPYAEARYVAGKRQDLSLKNLDARQVEERLDLLKNHSGPRGKNSLKQPVVTRTPSVQGVWQHGATQGVEFKITERK